MSLVRGKWPASHERGRLYAVSAPSVRRGIRPTSHCGRAALRGGRDVKIMRQERGSNGSIRSSALWGKPSKGETRSSALWGKGGRGIVALLAVAMMVTPMAAVAGSGSSGKGNGLDASVKAYLSPSLLRTAQLTGRQIASLARKASIRSITTDAPVVLSGSSNKQRWPYVSGFQGLWNSAASANAPTIAVVDSGIEAGRSDFGGRVLAQVNP